MADKSKFLQALKNRAGKVWKEARKAQAAPTLTAPTGIYTGRLRAVTFDLDKNGNPYFVFRIYLLSEDEDINGQPAFKTHFITPQSKDPKTKKLYGLTEQQKIENLKKDFDRVSPNNTLSDDDSDISDMVDLAQKLSEERPAVKLKVQRDEGDKAKKRAPETYQPSIWINGLAPEDEIPEADEPEEEDPEDDESEDDAEAEDDEGGEDTEDDEDAGDEGEDAEDGEAEGEEEDEDDEAPPEEYKETPPARSAKPKTGSGKKPATKPATTKPKQSKLKLVKGDPVLYTARAGGKPVAHTVLAVDPSSGLLKLKNDKTGAIVKDIDPKAVKPS